MPSATPTTSNPKRNRIAKPALSPAWEAGPAYAANWQPTADEIWSHTKIRESRYENYKDWKPNQQ